MELKVCVVTGSRSEYGLLQPLMRQFQEIPEIKLQLIVTGAHLSETFGETYHAIEADGFLIDRKVDMAIGSGSLPEISHAMGTCISGIGTALAELKPDLVVILGDRYEMLAVASACTLATVPIAHISGGEITEGAIDDSIRHALTKLSHLHLVSNVIHSNRVLQMGEEDWRVDCSGEPGLDSISILNPLSKSDLEKDLGLDLTLPTALVTFHPVTLESENAVIQIQELSRALEFAGLQYVITYPNADFGNDQIIREWQTLKERFPNKICLLQNLGQRRYLSLMHHVSLMIGNSSSGLVEAPLFALPAVNVGNRQKGRLRGTNVLDVTCESNAILRGIQWALEFDRKLPVDSPYGTGRSSARVADFILSIFKNKSRDQILRKKFIDRFRPEVVSSSIGGAFEIDPKIYRVPQPDWTRYLNLDSSSILTSSGRGAFRVILEDLNLGNKRVLVPDYLCGEAILPILRELGLKYEFYPVDSNLKIDPLSLMDRIDSTVGALVLVNYFGMTDHTSFAKAVKAQYPDLTLILDDAQGLFDFHFNTVQEHWANYRFGSFQKFFAIPDGGIAQGKKGFKKSFEKLRESSHDYIYLAASALKYQTLAGSFPVELSGNAENSFVKLFHMCGSRVTNDIETIGEFSEKHLAYIPFDLWATKRRSNFQFLDKNISKLPYLSPLFSNGLQEKMVPLAYPVKVDPKFRNRLVEQLKEHRIFCPIHWPAVDEVSKLKNSEAVRLSECIFSIPIDHRLDEEDLVRLLAAVDHSYKELQNQN
jgi:GDP/UDP-N,N'-diacetylbacillosamine 2-epimerase (hydrolysing)